jgi:hypothetical protein
MSHPTLELGRPIDCIRQQQLHIATSALPHAASAWLARFGCPAQLDSLSPRWASPPSAWPVAARRLTVEGSHPLRPLVRGVLGAKGADGNS